MKRCVHMVDHAIDSQSPSSLEACETRDFSSGLGLVCRQGGYEWVARVSSLKLTEC